MEFMKTKRKLRHLNEVCSI